LLIDSDAVLACSITFELLESISWWHGQIA